MDLPLSWRTGSFKEHILPLRLSRSLWYSGVSLADPSLLEDFLTSAFSKGRIVVRGCNSAVADLFHREGGSCLQTGLEAAIPLSGATQSDRTLRGLERRALRKGEIHLWKHGDPNPPNLADLRRRSPYAGRPYLRGLFLIRHDEWERAWEYRSNGVTKALVTVSRRSATAWHTEILMRDRTAPVGAMEAVILRATRDLADIGGTELSLGECPFILGKPPSVRMHIFGLLMRHAYHAKGLYRFKAKFYPVWRPVYVCSTAPLLPALIDLFFESGVARLFFGLSTTGRDRYRLP